MVNRDIENTWLISQMAVEAIEGMRLQADRRLAGLPPKTLLLDFVNAVAPLDTDEVICVFPLITEYIAEKCANNPLAFDWMSLAIAVDNAHGHFVCNIGSPLNTK